MHNVGAKTYRRARHKNICMLLGENTMHIPEHLERAAYFAGFGGGLGCDLDDEHEITRALGETGQVIEFPAPEKEKKKNSPTKTETTNNV